jgi:hypothetical protein
MRVYTIVKSCAYLYIVTYIIEGCESESIRERERERERRERERESEREREREEYGMRSGLIGNESGMAELQVCSMRACPEVVSL